MKAPLTLKFEALLDRIAKIRKTESQGMVRLKSLLYSLTYLLAGPVLYTLLALAMLGLVFYDNRASILEGQPFFEGKVSGLLTIWPSIFAIILIGAAAKSAFAAGQALFVEIGKRPGRPLAKEQAPELFQVVEGICKRLKCKTPKRIELADEPNACVYLDGGLLSHRPVLNIGMPLLHALNREEALTVLAHELGHVKRFDTLASLITYRFAIARDLLSGGEDPLINSLPNFLRSICGEKLALATLAYSIADARNGEEHADETAEALYPGAAAAKLRFLLYSFHREIIGSTYMPQLNAQFPEVPEEAADWLTWAQQEQWDESAVRLRLREITGMADRSMDPHPPCSYLLKLSGHSVEDFPIHPPCSRLESSAPAFLGEAYEGLYKSYREWDLSRATHWKENHHFFQQAYKQISTLQNENNAEEALASALIAVGYFKQSIPFLEILADRRPKDENVAVSLAFHLANQDIPDAPERTEEILKKFPWRGLDVLPALEAFHARKGDAEAVNSIAKRILDLQTTMGYASYERNVLDPKDALLEPDLESSHRVMLIQLLRAQGDVKAASVVRKKTEYFQTKPLHVLIVEFVAAAGSSTEIADRRAREIAGQLPPDVGEMFVVHPKSIFKPLWKKAKKLENTAIAL